MRKFEPDEFTRSVYEVVKTVPRGRATSYGAIARAVGHPSWARKVGRVMALCDGTAGIPAHRVVNSQGVLSGKGAFGEPGTMQSLLEAEGVRVAHDRIQNWRQVFWDPLVEIGFD